MEKIAIYGCGGLGREIFQMIEHINYVNKVYQFIGYFDDNIPKETKVEKNKVIGGIKELNSYGEKLSLLIAVGDPLLIQQIHLKIKNPYISYPNLIHPDIRIDKSYHQIGVGNIITFGCFFTTNIKIGSFNIFNTNVTLGHDVIVGSYNVLQPNVQVSGNVEIGNRNYLGVNSCIIQKKIIGDGNKIGAGSILMKNISDNNTYFGNPAIKINF
jgi:sugar O-acyltransferase (sialic acid O-acetyltransferase NeuD family)